MFEGSLVERIMSSLPELLAPYAVQSLLSDLQRRELIRDTGADGTQCLLLQTFNIPFCYDKFTTNYVLPDGAYGTVVTGNYTAPDGVANLLTGDFTLSDGTTGNVYGSASSPSKPDTATLTVPTQYTAAGVGSALPVSELGQWSNTTTIPGTTIEPSTVAAQTLPPSVVSGSTMAPATPKPATNIPGTTIPPITSTITAQIATASSSKTSNGARLQGCGSLTLAGSCLISAMIMMISL
ncbi:MAG: hypothetical protein Q9195_008959 [Heterodermia aff. obscurata]